jgi:hypothetical protein
MGDYFVAWAGARAKRSVSVEAPIEWLA